MQSPGASLVEIDDPRGFTATAFFSRRRPLKVHTWFPRFCTDCDEILSLESLSHKNCTAFHGHVAAVASAHPKRFGVAGCINLDL